jgi:hypothetical protein
MFLAREQKIRWKNVLYSFFFVIEHKVFFWKRLASALEEVEMVDDLILSPNSAKNNEKKEEKKPVKKSTFFLKLFSNFLCCIFTFLHFFSPLFSVKRRFETENDYFHDDIVRIRIHDCRENSLESNSSNSHNIF